MIILLLLCQQAYAGYHVSTSFSRKVIRDYYSHQSKNLLTANVFVDRQLRRIAYDFIATHRNNGRMDTIYIMLETADLLPGDTYVMCTDSVLIFREIGNKPREISYRPDVYAIDDRFTSCYLSLLLAWDTVSIMSCPHGFGLYYTIVRMIYQDDQLISYDAFSHPMIDLMVDELCEEEKDESSGD